MLVLAAAVKTLSRDMTQARRGATACAMSSANTGDVISCSSFSRCIASISGPAVSTTSTSKRLARASVIVRRRMSSELPRQNRTGRPYFFSKA